MKSLANSYSMVILLFSAEMLHHPFDFLRNRGYLCRNIFQANHVRPSIRLFIRIANGSKGKSDLLSINESLRPSTRFHRLTKRISDMW